MSHDNDNPASADSPADGRRGHHGLIGQPHSDSEGAVARAETVAGRLTSRDQPFGPTGPQVDRRSPFLTGMAAAAGVAVVVGAVWLLSIARSELILIGLAWFLAVGGEPVVSWLARHRWPRPLAVTSVVLLALAAVGGFVAGIVPLLVEQGSQLAAQAPASLHAAQDQHTLLGQLNARFHVRQMVEQQASGTQGLRLAGGLIGVGRTAFGTATSTLVVIVLAIYFLADMPRVRRTLYRLVPARRRPRAVLLGDAMFVRVGAYVLGNLLVSLIAGVSTLVVLLVLGVPYAFLLAVVVAVLDLIPVAGSVTAAVIVSLVSFTVSTPVALITVGFFVVYRFLEDYLLVPAIIGKVVKVPALVTLLAVLLGAALSGVLGMVVAIPIAAAIHLLMHELLFPQLDRAGAAANAEEQATG